LLDAFVESEGLDWEKAEDLAWLQSQDLEYHNVDPEEGLLLMLEGQGQVERLIGEKGIARALVDPPEGTRAYFRGKALEKFSDSIRSLNWDSIEFALDGRVEVVDLKGCVEPDVAARYNRALDRAREVGELIAALKASAEGAE